MHPYIPDQLPLKTLDWDALAPLIGQTSYRLDYYSGTLDALRAPGIYFYPMATQEAVFSSRIEGTTSTYEEVVGGEALPDFDPEKRGDIEEVMNYRRAMLYAIEVMKEKPLNLTMLREMHAILLKGVRGRDRGRGEFRMVQNLVGGATMDTARYVPPPPERVPEALDNWERYFHARRPDEVKPPHTMAERDPLVQLAILHAQFEIIHPFVDGNGRIGRLIIPLFLYQRKLISQPVFTISPYINDHRQEYYDRLNAVTTKDDWLGWIQFFLTAVCEQALTNSQQASEISDLFNEIDEQLHATLRSDHLDRAIEVIFEQPIFTTTDFAQALNLADSRQTAIGLLNNFKDEGVVETVYKSAGRRPETLALTRLLKIMKWPFNAR
jgi:Fic family protein